MICSDHTHVHHLATPTFRAVMICLILSNGLTFTSSQIQGNWHLHRNSYHSGAYIFGLCSRSYLLSSYNTCCPHTIPAVLIQYLLSPYHTCCPHTIPAVPIPYLLSPYHTYCPHTIPTVPIPYLPCSVMKPYIASLEQDFKARTYYTDLFSKCNRVSGLGTSVNKFINNLSAVNARAPSRGGTSHQAN